MLGEGGITWLLLVLFLFYNICQARSVSQSGLNQSYSQLPQERQYQVSLDKGLADLNSNTICLQDKRTYKDCSGFDLDTVPDF
jgi:hypothetical protein